MISTRMVAVALAAFLLNVLITPIVLRLAHRHGWYDHLNARKIHTVQTPRLGGVGIFLSVVVAAALGLAFLTRGAVGTAAGNGLWPPSSLLIVLAGLAVMHGLGLYDDFVNLRAPLKFVIQVASAGLVALSGARLSILDLPWVGVISLPPGVSIVFTVIWIVSMANAVNLIDGADGLAGGVSLLAAAFMGIIALGQGGIVAAVIAFALLGALAGFLVFNLPPAKTFMGDGGSLQLGFLLAVIPLLGLESGEPGMVPVALFPILTLLYIPIVDTLLAILRRLKRGLPVHSADREHIHHRLIDRGIHGKRLLTVVYSTMAVLGITAMTWYVVPHSLGGAIIAGVWVVALAVILFLGTHAPPAT